MVYILGEGGIFLCLCLDGGDLPSASAGGKSIIHPWGGQGWGNVILGAGS